MPNYKYVCEVCGKDEMLFLPISHPPEKKIFCSACVNVSMTRRIICGQFSLNNETLGGWYKNETGKELFGG